MQTQSTNLRAHVQVPERIVLQPTRKPGVFNIELHLVMKTVYPGKLDMSGEEFYRCKRKPEHFHRKLNAWGVNAEVVERYDFRLMSHRTDACELESMSEPSSPRDFTSGESQGGTSGWRHVMDALTMRQGARRVTVEDVLLYGCTGLVEGK